MKRVLSILAVMALVFSSVAVVSGDRLELASASEEDGSATATILDLDDESVTAGGGNSCPQDGGWIKVDNASGAASGDGTNDWGSLSWSGKTVEWDINDGWDVQLCVKSGSRAGDDFDENKRLFVTVRDAGSRTIGQDISHLSYKPVGSPVNENPDAPDVTVEFVKEWAGDPRGNAEATLEVDGNSVPWGDPLDVTDDQEETLTVAETVTGLPDNCTSTADTADYTVPKAATHDIHDTVTITNTVDCSDDETPVEATWPLTVVKNVAGPLPDGDFAFAVDCGDFQLGGRDKSFEIDADGGQKLIGVEIPEGTECTITETDDAGAGETSVTVDDGNSETGNVVTETIDEATTVTFLNTFGEAVTEVEPTAPLTVEKDVEGPAPDEDFDFAIECDDFGVGDDAAFSIDADGGTHTTGISIPEGTECTVTETDKAGADATAVTVNDGDPMDDDTVTFDTTESTTTVSFLNTFGEEPDETEVEDEDITPADEDPIDDDPTDPASVDPAKEDVTEVEAETLVAVETAGTTPTRIDAGGGGLATGQGPVGLTALVALMGGLFLALTGRSHRDQTV